MSTVGITLICIAILATNAQYFLVNVATTWSNAKSYCESTCGTHLAIITSSSQDSAARATCGSQSCWIGLYREQLCDQVCYVMRYPDLNAAFCNNCAPDCCDWGLVNSHWANFGIHEGRDCTCDNANTWKWVNGASLGSWLGSVQPDDYGGSQDCARLDYGRSGSWDDIECSYNYQFLCAESPSCLPPTPNPTKQPTTKSPTQSPITTHNMHCNNVYTGYTTGSYKFIDHNFYYGLFDNVGISTCHSSSYDTWIGLYTSGYGHLTSSSWDNNGGCPWNYRASLSYSNLNPYTWYKIRVGGDGNQYGYYRIVISCTTNSPTPAPTNLPTPAPTLQPTNAPTLAPTEAPSAFSVPTPSPIWTNKFVYVRNNGCDYGYCSSKNVTDEICLNNDQNSACKSISYAWNCFNGQNGCSSQGNDGSGLLDLGKGTWDFLYNVNYDDNNVIIRGQGPLATTLRYTGIDSTWIQCRWYKCYISLQDLTISSNKTSTNDIQFHMYHGGTLYFKNVVFDGDNYVENEHGAYWIFNEYRVNVMFENCYFTHNNVQYLFAGGTMVTFENCTFENNDALSINVYDGANVHILNSRFINNEISITSANAKLHILNCLFKGNYGIPELIKINNASVGNTFGCIERNINVHHLILQDNVFLNNTITESLIQLAATTAYLQNNIWNYEASFCVKMTDTNIYIANDRNFFDNKNFIYVDHTAKSMKNSICINNSVTKGHPHYFTFADDINNSNTQIIFPECYGLPQFEPLFQNISTPIHDQRLQYISPGASVDKAIACYGNTSSCSIICNNSVSCFLSDFTIDTSITTILCSAVNSCGNIHLTALAQLSNPFQSIEIICGGDSSCTGSVITINWVQDIRIECIDSHSCSEMQLNLTNTVAAVINCHRLSFMQLSGEFWLLFLKNVAKVVYVLGLYIAMDLVIPSKLKLIMIIPH